MHKINIRLVLSVVVSLVPALGFGHTYDTVTVEDDVAVSLGATDVAFDADGHVGVCYVDNTNDGLKYAFFDGNDWAKETVELDAGHSCNIVFDTQNLPHIVYYDVAENEIHHAVKSNGAWILRTVADNLAIDDVGLPFDYHTLSLAKQNGSDELGLAYYDATGRDLMYASFDGAAWNLETVVSGGDVGRYAALAFSSVDDPIVAYQEYVNANTQRVKIVSHNGANWGAAQTLWDEGEGASYMTLRVDGDDGLHVSFKTVSGFGDIDLSYVNNVDGDWTEAQVMEELTTTQSPEPAFGSATPFVLDEMGNAYFFFRDYFPSALFGNFCHMMVGSHYFYRNGYFQTSYPDRLATAQGGQGNFSGFSMDYRNWGLALAWVNLDNELVVTVLNRWRPAVDMADPAQAEEADQEYAASWYAFDPEGDAQIRFYYRDADFNQTLISEIDAEADGELAWDTSLVAEGGYRLVAQISNDGFVDYSESISFDWVTVAHAEAAVGPAAPPPPANEEDVEDEEEAVAEVVEDDAEAVEAEDVDEPQSSGEAASGASSIGGCSLVR